MTSGYAANEGLLSTVIEPGDWVASDELNHASIIDGLRLAKAERFIFRHNDLNHLEDGLRAAHERRTAPSASCSSSPNRCSAWKATSRRWQSSSRWRSASWRHVIVDEAHATGCFGPTGSGLVDALGLRSRVLATVHTGGKALGVPGAYVVGSQLLKELLVNRCRHLIFTTALPPEIAAWWLEAAARPAGCLCPTCLHANAGRFRAMLVEAGINAVGSHYVVPIIVGENAEAVAAATSLQAAGYDIRAIRPPTVPEGTRLRVSIHADHVPDALAAAARAIAQAVR